MWPHCHKCGHICTVWQLLLKMEFVVKSYVCKHIEKGAIATKDRHVVAVWEWNWNWQMAFVIPAAYLPIFAICFGITITIWFIQCILIPTLSALTSHVCIVLLEGLVTLFTFKTFKQCYHMAVHSYQACNYLEKSALIIIVSKHPWLSRNSLKFSSWIIPNIANYSSNMIIQCIAWQHSVILI